jgi:hypothetical protein
MNAFASSERGRANARDRCLGFEARAREVVAFCILAET